MPITTSAKKALRQSKTRKIRNTRRKKEMKSLLKKVKDLVSQNKIEEVKKLLPKVYKTLDKAAKAGLIKKNTAGRRKSRITKSILRPR